MCVTYTNWNALAQIMEKAEIKINLDWDQNTQVLFRVRSVPFLNIMESWSSLIFSRTHIDLDQIDPDRLPKVKRWEKILKVEMIQIIRIASMIKFKIINFKTFNKNIRIIINLISSLIQKMYLLLLLILRNLKQKLFSNMLDLYNAFLFVKLYVLLYVLIKL